MARLKELYEAEIKKNLKEKNAQNFQEIVLEIKIYQMTILLEKI